jgi:hypothetical protein
VKGNNNVVAYSLSRRLTTFSIFEIAADWKYSLLVEFSKNTFAGDMIDRNIHDDMYKIVYDII